MSALFLEHEASISELAVVLTTAVPLAAYVICLCALYSILAREIDPFHLWLVAGTAVVIAVAIIMAAAGTPVAACLLVPTLAPAVTVVGYEFVGHRHRAEMLARSAVDHES